MTVEMKPTGQSLQASVRAFASRYAHDNKHGPLPALLLVLTVATGTVDAVSILALGRVFVANMTGNIVFTGFAAVGVPGFSLAASLAALGGFLVGAATGGTLVTRRGSHRGVLLRDALGVELLMMLVAMIVVATATGQLGELRGSVAAAGLAVAMGVQNAVVRRLAVPDLTTTVLTMTLTGIAADVRHRNGATFLRRLAAVAAMFSGAIGGALLALHVSTVAALTLALCLVAIPLLGAIGAARSHEAWAQS